MALVYRTIVPSDDPALAEVIKKSLEEQGNNKPGTIYADPQLYKMSSGYTTADSIYYVVYDGEELLGGCGIARITCLSCPPDRQANQKENYCELQRMFLKKEARGKGIGAELMRLCVDFAKKAGYNLVYIETFCNMTEAIKLYERSGFEYIDGPLGNTGHFSCDKFLVKRLSL
ncbi:MAG: GNAT family N-acetyltransferase [Crocinitomicaceae bacterium]|nr:GNAT family N-acetyltransferase [Crocinitomicaceae bacterium]